MQFLLNDDDVTYKPFTANGVNYPAGWPAGISEEERLALGIVTVLPPPPPPAPEPPPPPPLTEEELAAQEASQVAMQAQMFTMMRDSFVRQVDQENDEVIDRAIGRRQVQYEMAEAAALAYKTAGYTGDVPEEVDAWVAASGMTPQAATDDILAQATAWRAVSKMLYRARLGHKRQAAVIPTPQTRAEIETAQQALSTIRESWAGTLGQIKAVLGQ